MKRYLALLVFLSIISMACSVSSLLPAGQQAPASNAAPDPLENTAPLENNSGETAVLLFTIGMHIEPFGETAQGFAGSSNADYHNPKFFLRHVEDIQKVADIIAAHSGRMTVQTQSPFTSMLIETGDPLLANLAAADHEIALHFHEDAHLGKQSQDLSIQQWCAAMREELALVRQAASAATKSGQIEVRYWSGGNLYPDLIRAADCAGLSINSDWKNPKNQTTDLSLVGVNPWRPSGGTDGLDFTAFTRHDPSGPVVFLPEGQFDQDDFASMRRSDEAGGDAAYFEYLKSQFQNSLAVASPGKVNVFHFTVHAGEFRGDPAHPFQVIDDFLSEVVDPAVGSGKARWATLSQMAEAYEDWEKANPGVNP